MPLPNEAALRRQINSIKKTEFPWMLEVTKCAVQYGIKNLGRAFQNFFKNPKHFGYPRSLLSKTKSDMEAVFLAKEN